MQPPSSPLLRFTDVTRVHGIGPGRVRALGPVSFAVRPGEFVAVMGPSGSGKSTLLALAGALDRPTEGRVWVDGADLESLPLAKLAALRRRTIGFVFQDLNLLPGLTAIENVCLPLELSGERTRDARALGIAALEEVRMGDKANRFPDDLSGGEQQRVAIARSIVGPRELLLADEPTGALDTVTGEVIMRLLRAQCAAGRTVVLVTHDATHAAWADRILMLRDGLIVDDAHAAESTRPSLVPHQP
ncbi:MAG: ABC transporter ATP-binding protein [Candidatus Eisenbacteria bacterium]|uniref:ABC transporter ATP-binding protein n=1 Tax=Eiseniibacteriota bacterium TaxID=2212470 RepID=A0A956LZ25_UNCEI|nr:ABC transporter ATP-binding protein [Candidatus Eisenbacteria bacterium]